jgi:hypothetical protein
MTRRLVTTIVLVPLLGACGGTPVKAAETPPPVTVTATETATVTPEPTAAPPTITLRAACNRLPHLPKYGAGHSMAEFAAFVSKVQDLADQVGGNGNKRMLGDLMSAGYSLATTNDGSTKTVRELDREVGLVHTACSRVGASVLVKPKPKPKPKPALATTVPGNGTFLVGKDVAAGTYRNTGPDPDDGRPCVAYTSSKPDDLQSYLRGSTSKGPGIVVLNTGEYFTTLSCTDFHRQ